MGKPHIKKDIKETSERREEIKELMESTGPYSVPAKELSEKWKVTVKTIYNDIEFWINKLDFTKIDYEGKKLLMGIRTNMALIDEIKMTGTHNEKLKAISTANQTAEIFTKLLEQYGFKEKIAEKLELTKDTPIKINIIMPKQTNGTKHKTNKKTSKSVVKATR